MNLDLTEEQDELLTDAKAMLRRRKFADFLNSPRHFFSRLRSGYYDRELVYNLRWLEAQDCEEEYEELEEE